MKATEKLNKARRKAWLAGIGAFDTGRELAVDKIDELFVNGSAFFNNILSKGESLEDELQEKLRVKNMMEKQIAALRAKLGMRNVDRDQQIEDLTNKVDSLVEVVAKLVLKDSAAKPAAKKAAKPAAKAAAKPAAKAAAKPAAKAAAKPAAKTAAKPAAKTAAKPAAKTAAKPAAKTAAKPAAKTAAKPATKTVAEPSASTVEAKKD